MKHQAIKNVKYHIEAIFVEADVKAEDLVHNMVGLDDHLFMDLLNEDEPNDSTDDQDDDAIVFMIDSDDELPMPFSSTDRVLLKRENDLFSDNIPFNVLVIYF